jgi:hypothetical protein
VEIDGAGAGPNYLLKEIMPAGARKEGSFIAEIAREGIAWEKINLI